MHTTVTWYSLNTVYYCILFSIIIKISTTITNQISSVIRASLFKFIE